jgi:uncharacterized Zn finger protein
MTVFLADYNCDTCGCTFEVLKKEHEVLQCEECGNVLITQILGGHSTKMHDPEILKSTLQQRSLDHSMKEAKKQAGWKTGVLPKDFGRKPQI